MFALAALALCFAGRAAAADEQNFFDICLMGTAAEVEAAIRAGADVNEYDRHGWTPLMRAARYNGNPGVIAALIEAGADLNARDYDKGWRPLHYAAYGNANPEVIAALVEAGADFRVKDAMGLTPLTWAVRHNKNPEISALLRKGVSGDIEAVPQGRDENEE
jgi:ankyrin repeat protein